MVGEELAGMLKRSQTSWVPADFGNNSRCGDSLRCEKLEPYGDHTHLKDMAVRRRGRIFAVEVHLVRGSLDGKIKGCCDADGRTFAFVSR